MADQKTKKKKKKGEVNLHPSGKPYIVLKGLEGNPPAGELNATQQAIDAAMPVLVPFWSVVIGLMVLNVLRILIRDYRTEPGPAWHVDPRD